MAALSTDTLAELIDRRHDCLRELLDLARRQHDLAAAGDVDGLLAVLGRKQPHLEALQHVAAALKPFREDHAEERIWPDPARRGACQRRWQECAAMYDEIVGLDPLADKWRAFGWAVREIDGHDMADVVDALEALPLDPERPTALVAHTVKGKGVSFAEDTYLWHSNNVNDEVLARALAELGEP